MVDRIYLNYQFLILNLSSNCHFMEEEKKTNIWFFIIRFVNLNFDLIIAIVFIRKEFTNAKWLNWKKSKVESRLKKIICQIESMDLWNSIDLSIGKNGKIL